MARVGDILAEHDDARSCAISSFNVALMAATIVSPFPCGLGSVENRLDVGRHPVRRRRVLPSPVPDEERVTPSAAFLAFNVVEDLRRSSSVASPSTSRTAASGPADRAAPRIPRSPGVLYSFSSSEKECEYGRITVA